MVTAGFEGSGVDRLVVYAVRLNCTGCSAFAWFLDPDWAPEEES